MFGIFLLLSHGRLSSRGVLFSGCFVLPSQNASASPSWSVFFCGFRGGFLMVFHSGWSADALMGRGSPGGLLAWL